MSGGFLARGVFVQGVFVGGVYVRGVFVWGVVLIPKIKASTLYQFGLYSRYPLIKNSIFHLRPRNVSYHTRLSGNEGQCFLHESRFVCLYSI